MFELALLPYFQRLSKKEPFNHQMQSNNIHGSAYDLRIRAPSYNGDSSKFLKSQQAQIKRKISAEKPNQPYTSVPQVFRSNLPQQSERVPLNYPPAVQKQMLELPNEEKTRRAMSSEKIFVNMLHQQPKKQERSPAKQLNKTSEFKSQILSGTLTFK